MRIIGIDPGPTHSGVAIAFTELDDQQLDLFMAWGQMENEGVCHLVFGDPGILVIEKVSSYGMPVGESTFETVFWSGRIAQAFNDDSRLFRLTNSQVRVELCKTAKAKEANVKQALRDLYPATGGGKMPQVGTKSQPGPLRELHGKGDHAYDALAVAWTYWLKHLRGEM